MIDLLSQYWPLLLALVVSGIAAGLAAGMFGIGGGAIIVPVLFFLFEGMGYGETAMHVAVSTSLATIILTSARSVMAHHKHGAVDWEIIRSWAPWIVVGALIGMAWGFWVGFVVVWFFAFARNLGMAITACRSRARAEMQQGLSFFDHL